MRGEYTICLLLSTFIMFLSILTKIDSNLYNRVNDQIVIINLVV